ncbi:hypothetical protein ACLOJK_012519, partial [Asimina triloba]
MAHSNVALSTATGTGRMVHGSKILDQKKATNDCLHHRQMEKKSWNSILINAPIPLFDSGNSFQKHNNLPQLPELLLTYGEAGENGRADTPEHD